jgi:DNA helicase INO80
MAMWLADDDQAAMIERREAEVIEEEARSGGKRKRKAGIKRKEVSMDDMYHEGESIRSMDVDVEHDPNDATGEGRFEDASHEASGAATPLSAIDGPPAKKRKGLSKKAKTVKQRLAVIDGEVG